MTPNDDLAVYERASRRLLGLIRGEGHVVTAGPDRFERASARLAQTRALLQALGNPQQRYPIVHVSGTSGKGSVAAMIAAILSAAGHRVGLRTSPYLQVATEKLQVGSRLIDARSLDAETARVIEAHHDLLPDSRLGYAEAWSALTFAWFAEQSVDLAVVEVGAGGRFDSTNVFDPEVSVITSVGLDHTASLGPTVADIAWHKAGIIKPGTTAVVGSVPDAAWHIIHKEAGRAGAPIVRVETLPSNLRGLSAMPGEFQNANAEIALAAVAALRARGFTAPASAVDSGLAHARMPGRLERMPGTHPPIIWLDGAHNVDKVAALARESCLISEGGTRPVVVLGVLKSKDTAAIATGIAPLASAIVATEPTVVGRTALTARDLAKELADAGFHGPLRAVSNPNHAMPQAAAMARALGANVVVTGSMYLVGQMRKRWYPDDRIVLQRTPWPALRDEIDQARPDRSVAL